MLLPASFTPLWTHSSGASSGGYWFVLREGRLLVDSGAPSPFDSAAQRGLRQDLEAALARLRPEYRRLIVMRYLEDLSYEDIAEVVGLPLGTVKSHLHRARAALGRLMAESGWGPGGPVTAEGLQPGEGSGS